MNVVHVPRGRWEALCSLKLAVSTVSRVLQANTSTQPVRHHAQHVMPANTVQAAHRAAAAVGDVQQVHGATLQAAHARYAAQEDMAWLISHRHQAATA